MIGQLKSKQGMTVKELMTKLSFVPQDAIVEIYDGELCVDPWCEIQRVDFIDREQFDDPEDDEYRDHSVVRIS